MKNIWKLLAVLAVIGGLTACNKNNDPEGPTDLSGGCKAVDLGLVDEDGNPLKIKWAAFNVGAIEEAGYGSYFAWGETKEKKNYDWSKEGDYKWGVYDDDASPKFGMTKYTGSVKDGDGLKTLLPEDDPATANWGTKWRTPTIEEFKALIDQCTWDWDETRKGYTVKNTKLGTSIFLPAAGVINGNEMGYGGTLGAYWSSSVEEFGPSEANYCNFRSDNKSWNLTSRNAGYSIRAVTDY